MFKTDNGEFYTGADFSKDLIKLTSGFLEFGKLRSDSFRSGVPTKKWQEMASVMVELNARQMEFSSLSQLHKA